MDSTENIRTLVADYVRSGKLLQLATSANNLLWLCHVWYASTEAGDELFFTSNKARRHSQEIRHNPVVAGGVVATELEGLGQKVRGLCFEGRAYETQGNEMERAYRFYADKWPQVESMFRAREIASGAVDMRMYRIQLVRAVLFDEVNFPNSPRQEVLF
jgi:uncharacterized protein YhbP (UPF0306 family)